MINPKWLRSAYIVENEAIDYDSNDDLQLDSKITKITMNRYRNFVAQYPSRTSYFQPVIEKLDYIAPEVIGHSPFLLLEGISDYSFFKFVCKITNDQFSEIAIIPGSGAGASGPLISYLLGRGERFLLLLDDDGAGHKAARRYKDEWYLGADQVKTLGEIAIKFKGAKLENVISAETKAMIVRKRGIAKASKKDIGLFFAECNAVDSNSRECISSGTYDSAIEILGFCKAALFS